MKIRNMYGHHIGQIQLAGALVLITSLPFLNCKSTKTAPDYPNVLRAIAEDIGALRSKFPQLKDFSPKKNLENLVIDYSYHTHQAKHHGGWTAGVPNPDADGLWFYINFHDPNSTAQIDTQPAVAGQTCLGGKEVTFLILEGPESKPLTGKIASILKRRGVQPCRGNKKKECS